MKNWQTWNIFLNNELLAVQTFNSCLSEESVVLKLVKFQNFDSKITVVKKVTCDNT